MMLYYTKWQLFLKLHIRQANIGGTVVCRHMTDITSHHMTITCCLEDLSVSIERDDRYWKFSQIQLHCSCEYVGVYVL